MARIPMSSGFTLCPAGKHIFYIFDVTYDEDFGKLEVKMINAQGITHTERYNLKDKNDEPNEGALNAFSYFAKNALNDFTVEDIDHTDLIGHFICAEVIHNVMPSKKDPTKNATFANLGDKSPANGFDTAPVAAALAKMESVKETAQAASAPASQPTGGLDLDSLLG